MKVLITRVGDKARLPTYSRPGDAGLDCFADDYVVLTSGEVTPVPLGFKVAIPDGYVGILKGRSGLARTEGVWVLGGIIDPNYRGVVTALLTTTKQRAFLPEGSRVCQLVIVPAPAIQWEEVPALPETCRGDNGFGSSGT